MQSPFAPSGELLRQTPGDGGQTEFFVSREKTHFMIAVGLRM